MLKVTPFEDVEKAASHYEADNYYVKVRLNRLRRRIGLARQQRPCQVCLIMSTLSGSLNCCQEKLMPRRPFPVSAMTVGSNISQAMT